MTDEIGLLEDLQSGNADQANRAWTELHRRYGRLLYCIAMDILQRDEEAQDVVQQALMNAMPHICRFQQRPGASLRAWLVRIVRNLSINVIRNSKRRNAALDRALEGGRLLLDPGPSMEERLDRGNRHIKLERLLDEMTPDHREILRLHYVEDMSYAEIARTLQIKDGTVMSRLSRARVKIAPLLANDGE